jgi:hypothetical protein
MFQQLTSLCTLLIFTGGLVLPATAADTNAPDEAEFGEDIEMAPFIVEGERLAVDIHARSRKDRRYAEGFAEKVVAVIYDTNESGVGHGLVIVGYKKEPHPLFVFQTFIALAEAGELDPAVAARADEVREDLADWEAEVEMGEEEDEMGLTFEMVVELLPLPLEGAGSKLYQWAWLEDFDQERMEARFRALRDEDFASDQLGHYDWVFYLPPKAALNRVLKRVLPLVMEAEDMGFFERAMVRGAIAAFKPVINKAMEGVRKGMLYYTVMQARSDWSEEDLEALTEAYIEVLMPDFKFDGGKEHEQAVAAIEEQMFKNIEYAKDPFIVPDRLETYAMEDYQQFVGDYQDEDDKKVTHRFRITDEDGFTWTFRNHDEWDEDRIKTMDFHPAGTHLLVRNDDKMTIEFLIDEDGQITGVEERRERRRKTVPVATATPDN